jgi:hypothetical protein
VQATSVVLILQRDGFEAIIEWARVQEAWLVAVKMTNAKPVTQSLSLNPTCRVLWMKADDILTGNSHIGKKRL